MAELLSMQNSFIYGISKAHSRRDKNQLVGQNIPKRLDSFMFTHDVEDGGERRQQRMRRY